MTMKKNLTATNGVVVYMPEVYHSTITAPGGTKFYVNNMMDDIQYLSRHGEVVTSSDKRFKVGDEVYFHHNCVRRSNKEGTDKKVDSEKKVFENMYQIPVEFIYLIKRGEEFIAVDPWCYVAPVEKKKEIVNGIEIASADKYERQHGIMKYSNESLREQGVDDGDHIVFNLYSEYEFSVDDEILYRMKTPWIIGKVKDE